MELINSVLTGLAAGLTLFFCLIVAGVIIRRRVSARISAFILENFVGDGKTPSPFASVVDSIAAVVAGQIAAHLKAVFLGLQSVEGKNERRAAAQAVISGNSVLGAIASAFPAVRRKLSGNPALADRKSTRLNSSHSQISYA